MEKKEYITRFVVEFIKLSGISNKRAFEVAEEAYLFLLEHDSRMREPEIDARDEIRAMV